jgi:hypothetical protein
LHRVGTAPRAVLVDQRLVLRPPAACPSAPRRLLYRVGLALRANLAAPRGLRPRVGARLRRVRLWTAPPHSVLCTLYSVLLFHFFTFAQAVGRFAPSHGLRPSSELCNLVKPPTISALSHRAHVRYFIHIPPSHYAAGRGAASQGAAPFCLYTRGNARLLFPVFTCFLHEFNYRIGA